MFIEYKVKFGQDGVTVTQCIDFDASTVDEDEIASTSQTVDSETSGATVAKEVRLSRAAPLHPLAAIPATGSGPGDSPRGSGPGDSPRGSGPGDSPRGSGLGDSPRGSGRVIVLGPVMRLFLSTVGIEPFPGAITGETTMPENRDGRGRSLPPPCRSRQLRLQSNLPTT